MKKFTKLFLSCAAVAAVTAAVATSAMAVDLTGDIAGTYSEGTITLTNVGTLGLGDTQTILVLKPEGDGTSVSLKDAKPATIIGIDQNASIATIKIDTTGIDTDNKTYLVAMGGTNGVVKISTFGKVQSVEGKEITVGDINLDGDLDATDPVFLAKLFAGKSGAALIGEAGTEYRDAADTSKKVIIGDINLDEDLDATDPVFLAKLFAGKSGEALIGKAGTKVSVVAAPAGN